MSTTTDPKPTVYWHRDLPPLEAEAIAEHTIEATSSRVPASSTHNNVWSRCRADLMTHVERRLAQEMARLGGRYAHVLHETVESRHDEAAGEAWLYGCFTFMLYR